MNVFIRGKAYGDLEHIYEWIRRDRPQAAVGVIERIFESLDRLAVFPFMKSMALSITVSRRCAQ